MVDDLFQLETISTYKNKEVPEDPEQQIKENSYKLSCTIEGGETAVSELIEGVKLSLEGEVEKRSETLDRNCVFTKKTELSKLPSYLMVQFVRFYWKKESATSGTKAGKAKILKAVAFPKVLDLYSICSPELKKSLDVGKEFARNKAESILPEEEEESKKKDSNGDVEMTDS